MAPPEIPDGYRIVRIVSEREDITWQHCYMIQNEDIIKLMCKYCGKKYSHLPINKLKEHLAVCKDVTDGVRKLILDSIKNKKRRVMLEAAVKHSTVLVTEDDNENEDVADEVIKNSLNYGVGMAVGKFFLDVGVGLKEGTNSEYLKQLVEEIGKLKKSHVVIPSLTDFKNWILKHIVQEIQQDVENSIKKWGEHGASLLVDQHDSENGNVSLDFSLYFPDGMISLYKSVDGTNNSVDNLFEIFKEVIEAIGVKNILQVVVKDEGQFIELGEKIITEFPSVFWSPCASRTVSLMLEDIMENQWVKATFREAKCVSDFLKKYHINNIVDDVYSNDFNTMKEVFKVKDKLVAMVHTVDWVDSEYSKTDEGGATYNSIISETFWKKCEAITILTSHLLQFLGVVRGRKVQGLGYVLAWLYKTKKEIKKVLEKEDLGISYEVISGIIDTRWKPLHKHNLHSVGFFLNPAFCYNVETDLQLILRSKFYDCLEKMTDDETVQLNVVSECNTYLNPHAHDGDLKREMAIRGRKSLHPADWWAAFGGACPSLVSLATRVLCQTCSLVQCQQANWIVHDEAEDQTQRDIRFIQSHMGLKKGLQIKEEVIADTSGGEGSSAWFGFAGVQENFEELNDYV